MAGLKVCVLTSAHAADDVRVFRKQATTLARSGFDVSLCAPHTRDEWRDGVQILAVRRPRSRLERMSRTTWAIFVRGLRQRADVYHLHDPELLFVGRALKLLRKKVVYDVHEDFRKDLLLAHYLPRWSRGPIARAVDWLEKRFASSFDLVVAATDDIARQFRGNPRVIVVRNYPLRSAVGVMPARSNGSEFTVVYAGIISPERGLESIVRSLVHVAHPVRLLLLGDFTPARFAGQLAALPGYDRVDYRGRVDYALVPQMLACADAGIVCFLPTPGHLTALPTKLFEYMAAGIPVIASNFDLWREIVEGHGAGRTVDPVDPIAIARAIDYLYEHPAERLDMGRRGREAAEHRLTWDVEAERLIVAYRALASPRADRRVAQA